MRPESSLGLSASTMADVPETIDFTPHFQPSFDGIGGLAEFSGQRPDVNGIGQAQGLEARIGQAVQYLAGLVRTAGNGRP